jgi:hypothetical protein
MTRITIRISDQDKKALLTLAEKEFRELPAQIAFMICQELQKQGLIESPNPAPAISAEVIQPSAEMEK